MSSTHPLFLAAIGGYPGMGKTTVVQGLSAHFGMPQLSSDTLKRAIKASPASSDVDADWLTFDLLFALADDFLQHKTSVFLDLNLGKPFHWHFLERMREQYPGALVLPIVLEAPREVCLDRIRARYAQDPRYNPPEVYLTDAGLLAVWDFFEQLERQDTYLVDAAQSAAEVQADLVAYLTQTLSPRR